MWKGNFSFFEKAYIFTVFSYSRRQNKIETGSMSYPEMKKGLASILSNIVFSVDITLSGSVFVESLRDVKRKKREKERERERERERQCVCVSVCLYACGLCVCVFVCE